MWRTSHSVSGKSRSPYPGGCRHLFRCTIVGQDPGSPAAARAVAGVASCQGGRWVKGTAGRVRRVRRIEMRKILLGTTAVVGAALLAPSFAAAQEAPTVRIGGFFRAYYGYTQQSGRNSTTPSGVPNNLNGQSANLSQSTINAGVVQPAGAANATGTLAVPVTESNIGGSNA